MNSEKKNEEYFFRNDWTRVMWLRRQPKKDFRRSRVWPRARRNGKVIRAARHCHLCEWALVSDGRQRFCQRNSVIGEEKENHRRIIYDIQSRDELRLGYFAVRLIYFPGVHN
mgnify:CR=1 FL=1